MLKSLPVRTKRKSKSQKATGMCTSIRFGFDLLVFVVDSDSDVSCDIDTDMSSDHDSDSEGELSYTAHVSKHI